MATLAMEAKTVFPAGGNYGDQQNAQYKYRDRVGAGKAQINQEPPREVRIRIHAVRAQITSVHQLYRTSGRQQKGQDSMFFNGSSKRRTSFLFQAVDFSIAQPEEFV